MCIWHKKLSYELHGYKIPKIKQTLELVKFSFCIIFPVHILKMLQYKYEGKLRQIIFSIILLIIIINNMILITGAVQDVCPTRWQYLLCQGKYLGTDGAFKHKSYLV